MSRNAAFGEQLSPEMTRRTFDAAQSARRPSDSRGQQSNISQLNKGKPVARQGRKVRGLPREMAQLPAWSLDQAVRHATNERFAPNEVEVDSHDLDGAGGPDRLRRKCSGRVLHGRRQAGVQPVG